MTEENKNEPQKNISLMKVIGINLAIMLIYTVLAYSFQALFSYLMIIVVHFLLNILMGIISYFTKTKASPYFISSLVVLLINFGVCGVIISKLVF